MEKSTNIFRFFLGFFLFIATSHASMDMIQQQSVLLESIFAEAKSQVITTPPLLSSKAPELDVDTVVYGFELSADLGAAEVLEFGSSAGVELHFKKVQR